MKKDALQSVALTVTGAVANYGTQVPQGMNRYIYRIKAQNLLNGANLLTISKQENGAVVAAPLDYFQAAIQYDTWSDPDVLLEDAAPLYVIGGTGVVGGSFLRMLVGGGSMYVTVWYEDAPAPS